MRHFSHALIRAGSLLITAAAVAGATDRRAMRDETSFLAATHAAMATMMSAMRAGRRGNVDADFAAMMVAHHQGAIAMAQAQLRYGQNEQLHRIAQGIIVTQQQEIAALRAAVGQLPAPAATPPD